MAEGTSNFEISIRAKYDEIRTLREELSELDSQLRRVNASTSKEVVRDLEKSYAEKRKALRGLSRDVLQAKHDMEQAINAASGALSSRDSSQTIDLLDRKIKSLTRTATKVRKELQGAYDPDAKGLQEANEKMDALLKKREELVRRERTVPAGEWQGVNEKRKGVESEIRELRSVIDQVSATQQARAEGIEYFGQDIKAQFQAFSELSRRALESYDSIRESFNREEVSESIAQQQEAFVALSELYRSIQDQIDSYGEDISPQFAKNMESLKEIIVEIAQNLEATGERMDKILYNPQKRLTEIRKEMALIKDNGGEGSDRYKALSEERNALEDIIQQTREDSRGDLLGQIMDRFGSLGNSIKRFTKTLSGGGGLKAALAGAKAGLIGLGAAIASNLIKSAFNKFMGWLKDSVSGLVAFRKAFRSGVGEALSDATRDINGLKDYADRLSTLDRNTAEYSRIRDEVVSKYGRYDRYLAQEIDRVGDLSTRYELLTEAITKSSLARKGDEVKDKAYRQFANRAENRYRTMQNQLRLSGMSSEEITSLMADVQRSLAVYGDASGLSDQQRDLLTESGVSLYGLQKQYSRLSRRIRTVDERYGTGASDESVSYAIQNSLFQAEKQRLDGVRSMKEAYADMIMEKDQRTVELMAEGASRQRAQADLDYRRQVQQLKRQQESLKDTYLEYARTEFLLAHPELGEEAFDMRGAMSLLSETNGPFAPGKGSTAVDMYQQMYAENQKSIEDQRKLRDKMIADINFQERQQMASDFGTYDQRRAAIDEKWARDLAQVPAQYKKIAQARHQLELAELEYDKAESRGNSSDIRVALENRLKAEIETLDEAVRPAAEARMRVTLAEFDQELAEKYEGRMAGRNALEATLQAELDTIEDKYKEIKVAMNRVRLAEYDLETVGQYGTLGERRAARESLLGSQRSLYLLQNPDADSRRIDALNAYEMAKFDWEEIADYGSYERTLEALKNRWTTFIETLPEEFRLKATKKMNAELLNLEKEQSGVYETIFHDFSHNTSEAIQEAITLAEEQLRRMGSASLEQIAEMRRRIDELKARRDEVDFAGWGASFADIVKLTRELGRAKDNAQMAWAEYTGAIDPDDFDRLRSSAELADDEVVKLNEDIRKVTSALLASRLADSLSTIGGALSEMGQMSRSAELSSLGETLSQVGADIGSVVNGFAQGGVIGGMMAVASNVLDKIVNHFLSAKKAALAAKLAAQEYAFTLQMLSLQTKDRDFQNAFGVDSFGRFVAQWTNLGEAMKRVSEQEQKARANLEDLLKADYNTGVFTMLYGVDKTLEALEALNEDGTIDWDKIGEWYESNGYTDREYDRLMELKAAYDALYESVQAYVSALAGNTVGDLATRMVDNFISTGSAIVDMTDNMNAFKKSIAESIVQSMLLEKVFDQKFQDDIASLLAGGDAEGAIAMYNEALDRANELAPEIERFLSGVRLDSLSYQSTSGAFQTMTQDQASELNGRFTALQISGEHIDASTAAIAMSFEQLVLRFGTQVGILDDVRDIQAQALLELRDINENTSGMVKPIKEMSASLVEIRHRLERL